jgi:hypothetical protein
MIQPSCVFVLGALVALTACAEQSAFTEADLERQRVVTRCTAQAEAARPVWNARQLMSRPGQPRPLSVEWRNEVNRRVAECLAASSPLRGRALDLP